MTLYRGRRGKLAQEIGQNILDAMETSSRNPQPFTAKSVSIHLNCNPNTGKYHSVDIAGLEERHRAKHIAMLQAMEALAHHVEAYRPPLLGSEP